MDKDSRAKVVELKQTKEFSQCLKSVGALISLLKNDRFWAEYSLLIKMTPKIAIRLRNSPYSRSLEQLSKVTTEFKNAIEPKSPFDEMKLFFESDIANEKMDKVQTTVKEFISQQQVLAQKLFMMGILSQKAFKLSQVWLELGQLVNHFLMYFQQNIACLFIRRLPNQHTARDNLKPLLQKLNIKLRHDHASKKLQKKSLTTKTTAASATKNIDFVVDDEVVKVSVDLG
ncbi:hypothetical protein TYRP_006548, partial [Tyrophagus putrescentiae]